MIVFLAECVPALVCNESVTKNKRRMGRNPDIYVHSVLGQKIFCCENRDRDICTENKIRQINT